MRLVAVVTGSELDDWMRPLPITDPQWLPNRPLRRHAIAPDRARFAGDAIAAVVDDFVPRLATDPQLKQFFTGAGKDSQMKLRQHVVELVCQATGGPCFYTGRDMRSAHQGLGISEAHWQAAATHFVATLDKFKVPAAEQAELVALVNSLKPDIVEKK